MKFFLLQKSQEKIIQGISSDSYDPFVIDVMELSSIYDAWIRNLFRELICYFTIKHYTYNWLYYFWRGKDGD